MALAAAEAEIDRGVAAVDTHSTAMPARRR
jgi:hypothetical protein